MRHPLLVPLLTLAALLMPASAARADFLAAATDPAGDSAAPEPGRDITAFAMTYDRKTGALTGAIKFRGAPDDTIDLVTLILGQRTTGGCTGYPAAGLSAASNDINGRWARFDSSTVVGARGEADRSGFRSQVQRLEVTSKALAGRRYDCAIATVGSADAATVEYDSATAPLLGQPNLAVDANAPKVFARNRTGTIRFVISNPGNATARGVKLALGKVRGMSITKPSRSLGNIAAGKRKTVRVKVRFSNRASTAPNLTVKSTSGRLAARGVMRLAVKALPQRPSEGARRGSGKLGTCLRLVPDLFGTSGGTIVAVPCRR